MGDRKTATHNDITGVYGLYLAAESAVQLWPGTMEDHGV